MKKNIFLHIGITKAASTTIQVGLKSNEQELLDLGWLVPESGGKPIVAAHHNLFYELSNNRKYYKFDVGLKEISEEINSSKLNNVILSSEFFYFMNAKKVRTTYEEISKLGAVKIVIILRRQDLWLASSWVQQIKLGMTVMDPKDFILEGHNNRGDFYNLFSRWAKWFGKENIKILILEKEQIKEHIFFDFLRECGLENLENITIPKSKNVSPSLKTLTLLQDLLKIRGIDKKHSLPPFKKLSKLIVRFSHINDWNQERISLVDKELYDAISDKYNESNKRLAKEYFNRENLFFEDFEERPLSVSDISQIKNEEFLELLLFINNRLQKGHVEIYQIREKRNWTFFLKDQLRGFLTRLIMFFKHFNIYFLFKTPELFDSEWYLSENPGVKGHIPYIHYLKNGYKEKRDPNQYFSIRYYLKNNPNIVKGGIEPLFHYLTYGWKCGMNPSPKFNVEEYMEKHPEVRAAGVEPLSHFLSQANLQKK